VKIVFLGTGDFARVCLGALVERGLAPALAVTPPPRRRRRAAPPEPTPVQEEAEARGVEVFCPEDLHAPEALARLRGAAPDVLAVADYGRILRAELLALPRRLALNVHASLLPRHRGATPVQAAILAGDAETGVTVQRMVARLDAGPILLQRAIPISDEDDAGSLLEKLAPLGGELLAEACAALASGRPLPERPQDENAATVCGRLRPGDCDLDWSRPALEVWRRVRACTPKPGARTWLLRDPPLALGVRKTRPREGEGASGAVLRVGDTGIDVACGAGSLGIAEVRPENRRFMSAREFENGYRLRPGERFGRP
jgi:methionyl-tRNA formyltransferase